MKHRFHSLRTELIAFQNLKISVSEENLEISNEYFRQIDELKNNWLTSPEATVSKTPIECYLNLQRNVEFLKKTASAADIRINPRCFFGFLQYLGTGKLPPLENLPFFDQQSQLIKIIAGTLIEAKPKELIYVKREAVSGEIDSDNEFFSLPPHQRLNIHKIFASDLFKVSFIATTDTLRTFLNKIASMKNIIFIRDIEIKSYSHNETITSTDQEYAAFSVILEVLKINPDL